MERLEHSFPYMPPMSPPQSPTASTPPGAGGDLLFENPHAVFIPWRGRIEMEALDLWKGLDASVQTDTRWVHVLFDGSVDWVVMNACNCI